MSNRRPRGALILGLNTAVLAGVLVLSGCSLPGYQSSPVKGDSWYSFGSNDASATYQDDVDARTDISYEPRVVDITPAVIRHQRIEREHSTLSPAVQALIEPQGMRPYRIGPGDLLRVIVYGQPELTNPGGVQGGDMADGQVVDGDGQLYIPYAGTVDAAGRTPAELRTLITQKISAYIRNPQVDVRVSQYRSQRVYVSGDISKPCAVPLTDVVNTVLQVLDECNTLSSGQSSSRSAAASGVQNIVLIRDGQSTLLDLNKVYATGSPIPVHPNDRLLVDDSANRVFMMGEFDQQQALPYSTGGMSLSDAISDAGGVSLDTANLDKIYVVRGFIDDRSFGSGELKTQRRPNVFKLDMGNVGGMLLANQFQLEPRDIVFAAPSSLVNFNRALSQITPTLNVLLQSFLLYDRAGNN